MCGKRSRELLGPSTRSGVAPWVRDWTLGLAPFLSHWTGEYFTALQEKNIWTFDLHAQFRDRPWQAFLITILVGAYIGYALESLISRTPLLYGKRVQFVTAETEETEKDELKKPADASDCRALLLLLLAGCDRSKIWSLNIVDIHELID